MPRKCVFGCELSDPTGVTFHVFPNPDKFPERFRAWVNSVGGRLEAASDYEYFRKKRVCDLHFKDEHRNRLNRLNALAVPFPIGCAETVTSEVSQGFTEDNPVSSTSFSVEPAKSVVPLQAATDQLNPVLSSTSNSRGSLNFGYYVAQEHNYCKSHNAYKIRNNTRKVLCHQNTVKNLRNQVRRLEKKGASLKLRLERAEKMQNILDKVTKNMSKPSQLFTCMQMKGIKKGKGRRFTLEEKVLSLSFYKRSPKFYKLLSKDFILPSIRTMKKLLAEVQIKSGINHIVFDQLKKTVGAMAMEDRLCTLIFDEMSITPNINYDVKNDTFIGLADYGQHPIADHVLVFMVKGIKKKYKQPVAYYFTSNMVKYNLKNLIKEVISHVLKSGLIVLCTVCDQSTINVSAIRELIKETKEKITKTNKQWRHDIFIINNRKIIPIFDVPHLIKGLRNNLLTKDMKYTYNGEHYIYKWEYIQKLYAADKSFGELRLLHKLTEEHVDPYKIKKMRVKTATQVFSHSVAVATEHLTARGDLSLDCKQIIPFTLVLDNLFDSLNCSTFRANDGKIYKSAVTMRSVHHELWVKAKQMLKSIRFIEKKKIGDKIRLVEKTVPSVSNFIKTIDGMEALWKVLSQKYCMDAFLTRNCNQDPIENFFGNIRSYGVRNVAPNAVMWEGAFKALLLNNYNSPHSIHSNCEEDLNSCLQTLDFFVKNRVNMINKKSSDSSEENVIMNFNQSILNNPNADQNDAGQRNYTCGWVLTKCLKNIVKGCGNCKETLLQKHFDEQNAFIRAKEYCKDKQWLCYPSRDLVECFHEIQNITTACLSEYVLKDKIKHKILFFVNTFIDFPCNCQIHKDVLKEYFVDTAINILIYSWCRSINRILLGKIQYSGDDNLKSAAQMYYNKHKNYK